MSPGVNFSDIDGV
jgi:hypothetical protein